jgi:cytochrome c556
MRAHLTALVVAPLAFTILMACGPKTVFTDADVPKMVKLEDVMWSQAQAMDPQFKKMGNATFSDDDYTQLSAAGGRLKLTTAKVKESFSKGPEFNQFADTLAQHADELIAAAGAKDAAKAKAALQAAKDTCKACHAKFR